MPGIDNGVFFGINADFSNTLNGTGASTVGELLTDGQLWIGSTATNAGGTHINVGKFTSPNGTITLGFNSPNITMDITGGGVAVEHLTGDSGGTLNPDGANNFNLLGQQAGTIAVMDTIGLGSTIKFENRTWTTALVVDPSTTVGLRGTFTTITLAMAAAVSGNTIFVRPGTYTENFTWTAGVDIVAYDANALTPNVTIIGKITCTDAGSRSMSGINLQTNSDYLLSVTGVAATFVNLKNCYINCLNNTGINNTSTGSSINLYNCRGNIGTTGITLFTGSAAGGMTFEYCRFQNTGSSTTASTMSGNGQYFFKYCYFEHIFSNTGTGAGFQAYDSSFNVGAVNAVAMTYNSTAAATIAFERCSLSGGTSSALSIGAGAAITLINCDIGSSNTNAITGSGTLNYSNLTFSSSSSTINTTTQVILPATAFQKINVQTFTNTGTYTPTAGMKYCTIECVGGGGGGGGTTTCTATQISSSSGGAGGGYARKTVNSATIGTSQAVTIGAGGLAGAVSNGTGGTGGTTSLGTLCVATGGSGGQGDSAGTSAFKVNGVNGGSGGGVGTTGDVLATGGPGTAGIGSSVTNNAVPGFGGSSALGGGGFAYTNGNGAGTNGFLYGGGGAGSTALNSGTGQVGGAGAKGVCIVTEYI